MGKANKEAENKEKSPFTEIFIKLIEGMTQQEVADLVGVSRQNVGAWIKGDSVPSIYALPKIAEAFNVSTDYLLGRGKIKSDDEDVKIACKVTKLSEEAVFVLSEVIPTLQLSVEDNEELKEFNVKDWLVIDVLSEMSADIHQMIIYMLCSALDDKMKNALNDYIYGAIAKATDKCKYKIDKFIQYHAQQNGIENYRSVMESAKNFSFDFYKNLKAGD